MDELACFNARSVLCAALAVLACTGCASDDDDGNVGPWVPPAGDGGLTTLDASPILGADTGVGLPQPDGGLPNPFDSGPGPVIGGDSGPGPVIGGDSGPGPGTPRADLGQGDGKDVITIGDSWMSYSATEGIQNSLEKASMRDYRNFGVSGKKLLDEVIPNQYKTAKMQDPDIKTVIMTGGGNDILQDVGVLLTCNDGAIDMDPTCKARIDQVAARLVTFWAEMAADGVQDVVVIGYSRKADLFGSLKKSVDYSSVKIDPLCAAAPAPLRCHSFDSDKAVPNLALRDDIHPDSAGYDAIGAALWELMKAKGMRR